MTHEKPESSSPSRTSEEETKLAGPAYPPEILEKHPELGQYVHGPYAVGWPEIPGMVQMTLAVFVPNRGWLTTKRSVIYGGRHGPPPMIDDDAEEIENIMRHELRSGLRAMKERLARD